VTSEEANTTMPMARYDRTLRWLKGRAGRGVVSDVMSTVSGLFSVRQRDFFKERAGRE
jgi:hypothetical protein